MLKCATAHRHRLKKRPLFRGFVDWLSRPVHKASNRVAGEFQFDVVPSVGVKIFQGADTGGSG